MRATIEGWGEGEANERAKEVGQCVDISSGFALGLDSLSE